MTSKEALEELYKLTCIDNRNNVWTSCELCAVIAKDLNRLEKENYYLKLLYNNIINCIKKFNDEIIDCIQDFNNSEECEENETNN